MLSSVFLAASAVLGAVSAILGAVGRLTHEGRSGLARITWIGWLVALSIASYAALSISIDLATKWEDARERETEAAAREAEARDAQVKAAADARALTALVDASKRQRSENAALRDLLEDMMKLVREDRGADDPIAKARMAAAEEVVTSKSAPPVLPDRIATFQFPVGTKL